MAASGVALTRTLLSLASVLLASCSPEPAAAPAEPPSFLVVVVDTLRADAVSAYGHVQGTTPHLDALAREGIRYRNAFAPAPWTLPSHATLLTGLPVEGHGVGVEGRMRMPDGIETLAARMTAAGYATAGFSENPIVSHPFHLDRGFEHFTSALVEDAVARDEGFAAGRFDVLDALATWAAGLAADRPFFAFVNLYDAHDPYEVRAENPFVPSDVSVEEARGVSASAGRLLDLCERLPSARDLATLRGLYLGDVQAADAKLGAVLEIARAHAGQRGLVTVVTSDHGEHLGEHGLLGHEFSVRDVLVRVPLVLHGVAGATPGVVDATVALRDLAPSLLAYADANPIEGLPGRVLPLPSEATVGPRELVAVWSDAPPVTPPGVVGVIDLNQRKINHKRVGCAGSARVFGDMAAVTRLPHRLVWFEDGPSELYDLERDPDESVDVAGRETEVARQLEEKAEAFWRATRTLPAPEPERVGVSPEAIEALRALGYVE